MATFSEPERFLVKEWPHARLLEEAMKTVRDKYEAVLDQVLEEIMRNHRELDCKKKMVRPMRSYVGLAKKTWPKNRWGWPSGFYLENVQLECLTSPQQALPWAYVSIDDDRLDWKEAEDKLAKVAKVVLSEEEFSRMSHAVETHSVWLGCQLNRDDLLRTLVEDEASGFVSYLVDQFEWMVKFTPLMDDIFVNGKRNRK